MLGLQGGNSGLSHPLKLLLQANEGQGAGLQLRGQIGGHRLFLVLASRDIKGFRHQTRRRVGIKLLPYLLP